MLSYNLGEAEGTLRLEVGLVETNGKQIVSEQKIVETTNEQLISVNHYLFYRTCQQASSYRIDFSFEHRTKRTPN